MTKPNFKIDEITLILIVAVLAIVVSFYDNTNNPGGIEAEKITSLVLDDHDFSLASNGTIDIDKLKQMQSMDYSKLKNFLKAKKDFCIYIEDGNGNLLLAKGYSKLSEDGLYCKE